MNINTDRFQAEARGLVVQLANVRLYDWSLQKGIVRFRQKVWGVGGASLTEVQHRHLVTTIQPAGASFTASDGVQRPFLALQVEGVNGVGDKTQNVLLFAPDDAMTVAKIIHNCANSILHNKPLDPESVVTSFEKEPHGYL